MPENNILPNANNVSIAGSTFNQANTVHHYQTPETRTPVGGLGLLFERSALSALVDSNARYDAPKCDEGTREAIIQRIMDWIESDENWASALWLHGSAGSGKSALARTIAELCAARKSLLATFFFTRTRNDRITDGNLLIPTLAYQLAEKMLLPRRYIRKCLLQDPGIFHKTREVQMQKLIINPLNTYFSLLEYHYKRLIQKTRLRLIVIDGLDECFGKDVQSDLLRVLGQAVEKLRFPVRFLVSSRPEPQIRDSFNDDEVLKADRLVTLNLNDDSNTARDVRTYLEVQFMKIRNTHKIRSQLPASWPLAEDITTLIERTSGQFIFASTVVGYVSSSRHDPVARLTIIIERLQPPPADAPYGQLDLLYQLIFSSAEESGVDISKVLQVLGILIVARPEGALDGPYSTYAGIGRVSNITPGQVFLLLDEFVSLIEVPPLESMLPIRILHASLADFLLDPSRSGRFFIDIRRIHRVLALHYSKEIPTRISEMTSSTHRDDLNHCFLPFITHQKHADIPPNDDLLCDAMLLSFEAMFFLCQCLEPCEDTLWTAYHELLTDDPSKISLVSERNKQIITQRPIILIMTPPLTLRSLHYRPFSLLKRTRHIGSNGPERSFVRAVNLGGNSRVIGEGEVIVIDIPLVSYGHSKGVLEWLKRLENKGIKFSGVLFCQDVDSDVYSILPGGACHQIFDHCQTVCPVALVLIRRSLGRHPAVIEESRNINSLLRAWQQAVQAGGTLLWSKHRGTHQSEHQTLWDMLSETTTWKQQRDSPRIVGHEYASSVLKEIGKDKGPIPDEAWEQLFQSSTANLIGTSTPTP